MSQEKDEQAPFPLPGEEDAVKRLRAWYRRTYPLIRPKRGVLTNIVDTGDFRIRIETGTDQPRVSVIEDLTRTVQCSAPALESQAE